MPVGLEQATDLINAGNYQGALEASRTVLMSYPENISAKLIEAIALSQMGNTRDASEAFQVAIQLDPTNVKANFNAAVHEYNAGNIEVAQGLIGRVLELDPSHAGAKALQDKVGKPAPKAMASAYQRVPAADLEAPHEGIAFIERMGKGWDVIGWTLSLISFATVVYVTAGFLHSMPTLTNAAQGQDMKAMTNAVNAFMPVWLQVVDVFMRLGLIVWMVMDILHRRANFLWLLLHIPCSCINFGFISQPIYMFFGRK